MTIGENFFKSFDIKNGKFNTKTLKINEAW